MTHPVPPLPELEHALRDQGFVFVPSERTRALLEPFGLTDWDGFAASWGRLGLDRYMADGGRYRRRRHATYVLSDGQVLRRRHQPHYQSRDYNELNGGIERWFRPVEPEIGAHPALIAVLRAMYTLATDLTPPEALPEAWHTEIHQFRIEASLDEAGQPTPEGLHRDGVDWVMVLMISRENIAQGETSIHGLRGEPLGGFTLDRAMDAAIVDDNRVFHGVTPVRPLDPTRPAFRDVLVVTLRHQ
ncbi:hypothetical protein AA103196_0419 [Ameyamaea chiangmaiensis NBRC 103196]|uniref:2OG-Fe dioxygenase family protein n=1 Tax=Ameyamaea chiangmaiensis TaxID=442969 RepID=A0A850PCF8_9PROT|nr:2OG-Fe dioxygenase family protein [Ameyamaea chiangmaiensis]MBS4074816.1 2OG-Fe dioxygenase family protein [Ameyamaea chiangmaiensis]NVN41648.1 2OG-Fe dioxygenase family protein [Ameyamaea chiangmaiensis]GBQ62829.1 hypothetical protein AA103196_0419 [Ameyamaea chiangmaiensis NBRC 103196]